MNDNIFDDTNILVYFIVNVLRKRAIADDLLMKEWSVMSPYLISEFVAVTFRKQRDFVPKNHI